MTTSISRLSYGDCYELFDRALTDGVGCRVKMPSYGTAGQLRIRLHTARQYDRQSNREIYSDPDHPMHGTSEYDKVCVRVLQVEESWYVQLEVITLDGLEIEGLSDVQSLE